MTPTTTIGVDPGGAHTGLVMVHGADDLVDHLVLDREKTTLTSYCVDVADQVALWAGDQAMLGHRVLIAVEGLVKVVPHVRDRPIDPFPIVEAGVVLGAVIRAACELDADLEVVRPGGHGSQPLHAYPAELVGPREKKGTGRLRHARSAWDVARAGRWQQRVGAPWGDR